MEFIGENLKNTRVKKNYKLSYISKQLNISNEILSLIEEDNFPDYIDSVYLIGHIKSYAKFLDLDEKQIIKNFKIQISYNKNENIKEITKPIKSNFFPSLPKSLAACSIIAVASSFYFIFFHQNNFSKDFAITPDMPENLIANIELEEMNIILLQNEKNNQTNDNNKEEILLKVNPIKKIEKFSSSSAIASSPDKDFSFKDKIITLKFTDSTWIQLRDKQDNIIFSKLMDQNEEYSYNLSKNFNLTAGNAGNIVVSIDGVVKGKVGKLGAVVESLIIDSNFNR
tara:strand:- start:494 stop:1342 length:849 start_codon:yes stop_codon:yes gene_type:complete